MMSLTILGIHSVANNSARVRNVLPDFHLPDAMDFTSFLEVAGLMSLVGSEHSRAPRTHASTPQDRCHQKAWRFSTKD